MTARKGEIADGCLICSTWQIENVVVSSEMGTRVIDSRLGGE